MNKEKIPTLQGVVISVEQKNWPIPFCLIIWIMTKEEVSNFGFVTLIVSTLLFVKLQLTNNPAYAQFQGSFNFLFYTVFVFALAGTVWYVIYKIRKSR